MLSLKLVIRCADFAASRRFYGEVLGLEEHSCWDEEQGPGCIFHIASGGLLEIQAMTPRDPRFDEAFTRPVVNDKIDVQLSVASVDAEVSRLTGRWPFEKATCLPWGQRWIRMRDPDGVLVALYENSPGVESTPQ